MATQTAQPASKSSKKKAAKAAEASESPAPSVNGSVTSKAKDDIYENPYIKELQKNIRSINKRIINTSKTDTILKENPNKSLDDLVAQRLINTDQKAQYQNKPLLEAQLIQLEEALVQYQKVDQQYRTQAAADKAEWEKKQTQIITEAKAEAVAEIKENLTKDLQGKLLILSQFLRLAAYRREEAAQPDSDESQAIEGVLLAIYTGDETAVDAMLNLVNGSSEPIWSVPGEQLQTAYSHVKSIAQGFNPQSKVEATGAPQAEPVSAEDVKEENASTEAIDTTAPADTVTSHQAVESVTSGVEGVPGSDNLANTVEKDSESVKDSSISQEWVDVKAPTDATEAHAATNGASATVGQNSRLWSDEQVETAPEPVVSKPVEGNDGFHQVQRKQGRYEGGNQRGRGRGGFRGRGQGEGRGGRGRGNRGAGGPPRGGPRRTEIEAA